MHKFVNNYTTAAKADEYFILHKKKGNLFLEQELNDWLNNQMSKYLNPNSLICDLGSGTGRFFEELKRYSRNIVGIEESDEMIEKCLSFNAECRISSHSEKSIFSCINQGLIPILKGNVFEILPQIKEEMSFDFIFASFILPGIKEFRDFFEQIASVLKRGGKLLLTDNIFVSSNLYGLKRIEFKNINGHNESISQGTCFRQVLHLNESSIGLQNFVHTLEQYKNIMGSVSNLQLRECMIFPPEGCLHVASEYEHPDIHFPNLPEAETLLEPSREFKYVKLGMLMEKV